MVSYTYDTWGKLLSIKNASGQDVTSDTTSIGYINQYRYRGYRYDNETSMYYLNSRYYNSDLCRFISTDDSDILKINTGELLGYNLFAYCTNDPVNNQDDSGYWKLKNWQKIAIGGAVIAEFAIATIATGGATLAVAGLVGATSGAISGMATGAVFGYISGGLNGAKNRSG